ncbi:uncharacterized protein LOC131166707 [Malania oleifera]|uniref:uncharacterized protein LOC131166707 n=1 Tax=Malania oleifera TaxID=397392 RepID=UPI0025AE9F94|nr:uncharacterized protein LOC131166707 [Malania oleifera]
MVLRSLKNIEIDCQANQQVLHSHSQSTAKLETALGQLVATLSRRDEGKLPSQPIVNPRGKYGVECELDTIESHTHHHKNHTSLRSHRTFHGYSVTHPEVPLAPFIFKKEASTESIWDMFKQVRMDKSLLDDIKQSPMFTKFLKDFSMQEIESRGHMDGLVKQTEHMSSIILKHLVPKFKDLGSPTISYVIGNYTIDEALLDLGASVNILSYSAYQKLNPGVLQPTLVSICLADRSLKQPRCVVEDVVIKDGIMDISWGHNQHRLNIFNTSQHPLNAIQAVDKDVIDKIVREATPSML